MANNKILHNMINQFSPYFVRQKWNNLALNNINKLYGSEKDVEVIGFGSDGLVISISNDRVFKLTRDMNEAVICNDMLVNPQRYEIVKDNIPKIYKVRKINDNLCIIEMKKYQEVFEHEDDKRIKQIFLLEHFLNNRMEYSHTKIEESKFIQKMKVYHNDTTLIEQVLDIVKRFKKMGVLYTDIFHKNILTDGVNVVLIDYARIKVSDQLVNSQVIAM